MAGNRGSGRKLSLKVRLMISYGLMALFLVVSLLLISSYMLEHHFQSYVRHKQERMNQNLVALLLEEFDRIGMPDEEFLGRLGADALNEGIMLKVEDAQAGQIYCAGCSSNGTCDNMQGMMKSMMRQRYPGWEGEYTEKSYPLEKDGQSFGSVTLGNYGPFFLNEEDQQFIKMVNVVFLISALVFLMIAFGVGAFLAARIAKPIKYVIDRTKAIERNSSYDRIEFVSNTTEIAQLIDSVNSLADTLKMQQKIKKRMAGDYAHEFRTPLTALQSNLEGMIDGIFHAAPERLENCRTEILRLSRMTSEIDKLVEIENDNLFLNRERFDMGGLLSVSVKAFEREIHEKKLTLDVNAPTCSYYGERDKLSQVIVNLLSNAIKYTDNGGRIMASVKDEGDYVVLSVGDNGVGIKPEDLPHIFEYLYRADHSRARDTGGSGIGLSVVQAIVSAHGGTVEVSSQVGQGSEFRVSLRK